MHLMPPTMVPTSPLPSKINPIQNQKKKKKEMVIKYAPWPSPSAGRKRTPSSTPPVLVNPIHANFEPSFYDPHHVKHRQRMTSDQCQTLEAVYICDTKPNATKRHVLAQQLGMSPRTIQIWFQNKRAKAKQKQQRQSQLQSLDDHDLALPVPLSASSSSSFYGPKLSPGSVASTQDSCPPMTCACSSFQVDPPYLDPVYLNDLTTSSSSSDCSTAFTRLQLQVSPTSLPASPLADAFSDPSTAVSTPISLYPPTTTNSHQGTDDLSLWLPCNFFPDHSETINNDPSRMNKASFFGTLDGSLDLSLLDTWLEMTWSTDGPILQSQS